MNDRPVERTERRLYFVFFFMFLFSFFFGGEGKLSSEASSAIDPTPITEFYWVLRRFTELYRVLPSFASFGSP